MVPSPVQRLQPASQERAAMSTTLDATTIWNWAADKKPSLDTMLAVKQGVLTTPAIRNAFAERMRKEHADSADARTAGLARWVLGHHTRAFHHLAELPDKDATLNFVRADCCLKGAVALKGSHPQRRPDLAADYLQGLPERKTDARVQALYCDALLFDHRIEDAQQALADAGEAFRKSPHGHYVTGRIAAANGDHDGAEASYRAALAQDPTHRATLMRYAFELDLAGRDDEALVLYQRLASMPDADTHGLVNLGIMHEDRGSFDEAVRCFRRVVDAYPLHRRGSAYLEDARASINMTFDEETEEKVDRRAQMLRILIADFDMSVRSRNCLATMGVETLGDLVQKSEAELMSFRNFGETSLLEIKKLLADRGLRLGMNLAVDELPPEFTGAAEAELAPEGQPLELPPGVDPAILSRVFADMDLSIRLRKALATLRITTIQDVLSHKEGEFLSLKNCGQTTTNELKARLAEFGITLRP